jgi:hypothetical protein
VKQIIGTKKGLKEEDKEEFGMRIIGTEDLKSGKTVD